MFDLKKRFLLKEKQVEVFFYDLHHYSTNNIIAALECRKIATTTIFDENYPALLRQIYDPPWVLYGIGNFSLIHTKQIGVVGTRYPTKLGEKSIEKILPSLIDNQWTIVSGLAKGIDSLAHEQTIAHNGYTVAVLGSGLQYPYPPSNLELFQEICKNHLVISEYPPNVPPAKWQFPARNRIISGLSKAILVVEAQERSGSLITADQALEQGRDVYAVPGPIFSPKSDGTNFLIQQGAKLIRSAEDILIENL